MISRRCMSIIVILLFCCTLVDSGCDSSNVWACIYVDGWNLLLRPNGSVCGCFGCDNRAVLNSAYNCAPCNTVIGYCDLCASGACTACQLGFGVNSASQCTYCQQIMLGCKTCNAITAVCLGCYPQFFFNTSNICDLCSNYMYQCYSCTDKTTCTLCNQTYGFNSTHGCELCSNAITNCSKCFNTSTCTECFLTNWLNTNDTRCTVCQKLIIGCSNCFSSTVCISCNQTDLGVNYTSIPNTCVPCSLNDPNCIWCAIYSFCLTCINNTYILKNISPQIQTCEPCKTYLFGCNTCSSQTFCLSCIDNQTLLYDFTNHNCVFCSFFLQNCATCTPTRQCLTCIDNQFAVDSSHSCTPCSTFMSSCYKCDSNFTCILCLVGKLMPDKTGCTKIIGCATIFPLASPSNNCKYCDTRFFNQTPYNGRCECTVGWIVGSYCTTVIGCIGLKLVKNLSVCISCNTAKHFKLENETCLCKEHYQPSGDTCVDICGDGYVITLACDDGNIKNGDGCSSKCQIQALHGCDNDNTRSPSSKCQLRAKVQLSLNSIQKASIPNSAKITLDIKPFSNRIKEMNFASYISFNAANCTLRTINIVNQKLVIVVEYNRSIDQEDVEFAMDFDYQYVKSPQLKFYFKMIQSQGIPLTYGTQTQFSDSSALLISSLNYLTLAIFALGSFAFKMIGVETLYTIQISWLIQVGSKYYKTFFNKFEKLNYSYGQMSLTNHGELLETRFSNLGFTNSLDDNFLLYAIINGIIIVIYSGFIVYRHFLLQRIPQRQEKNDCKLNSKLKNKSKRQSPKMKRIKNILQKLYNWIVFPIFIGFLFHFLQTLIANEYKMDKSTPNYYALLFLLVFIVTAYIFYCQIFKINIKWRQQKSILKNPEQNIYVAYFLIHNFFLIQLFTLTIFIKNMQLAYFVAIFLVVFHLTYLTIKRPYESAFHNLSIIFNQMAILFSFFWVISKGSPIDTAQLSSLFIYVFIGLSYAVSGLGAIRSIITLKGTYWKNKDQINQGLKPENICQPKKQQPPMNNRFSVDIEEYNPIANALMITQGLRHNDLGLKSIFLEKQDRQSVSNFMRANKQKHQLDISPT